MNMQVLIAHAPGEEQRAEELAEPLRQAGYSVAHRGTVFVGESVIGEVSKILSLGGPVVLCGTVAAMGTGWAHRITNAARQYDSVRVFGVQMEEGAYLEPLTLGDVIVPYWLDPSKGIQQLLTAIQKYYPLSSDQMRGSEQKTNESYEIAHEEFVKQKQRVEVRLKENQ